MIKKNTYSVNDDLFLNFGHKNTQVYNVGIGLNFFLTHSCIFPKNGILKYNVIFVKTSNIM